MKSLNGANLSALWAGSNYIAGRRTAIGEKPLRSPPMLRQAVLMLLFFLAPGIFDNFCGDVAIHLVVVCLISSDRHRPGVLPAARARSQSNNVRRGLPEQPTLPMRLDSWVLSTNKIVIVGGLINF